MARPSATEVTASWTDATIYIVIVNAGRRPVILTLIGSTTADDQHVIFPLAPGKGDVRLDEHERFDYQFEMFDSAKCPDDIELYAEYLWVQDTLGNRHEIPCRPCLKKMREQRKQITVKDPNWVDKRTEPNWAAMADAPSDRKPSKPRSRRKPSKRRAAGKGPSG